MRRLGLPAPQGWAHYEFPPSFVLGFHGCDQSVGEKILSGKVSHLDFSQNDYDWLGSGVYFWEGNPARALEFALERVHGGRNSQGRIRKPFVLGAIINLKRCLDLADASAIAQVKEAYPVATEIVAAAGVPLPQNGKGLKARRLDCLVFNTLHRIREEAELPAYDTIRGLFWEGEEVYAGAGVREANHIQLCVRSRDCILGYFRPILADV